MGLKCCIKTDFDALEWPVSRCVFGSLPHLFVLFNIAARVADVRGARQGK
jgi:hypothetical protein